MDFISTNEPFDNVYPKLVRDKIPALHKTRTGKAAKIVTLKDDKEYLKYLFKKLVEESQEAEFSLTHGNTREELADILEVIDTILALKRWTWAEIEAVQKTKREKNGSFKKRILKLQ